MRRSGSKLEELKAAGLVRPRVIRGRAQRRRAGDQVFSEDTAPAPFFAEPGQQLTKEGAAPFFREPPKPEPAPARAVNVRVEPPRQKRAKATAPEPKAKAATAETEVSDKETAKLIRSLGTVPQVSDVAYFGFEPTAEQKARYEAAAKAMREGKPAVGKRGRLSRREEVSGKRREAIEKLLGLKYGTPEYAAYMEAVEKKEQTIRSSALSSAAKQTEKRKKRRAKAKKAAYKGLNAAERKALRQSGFFKEDDWDRKPKSERKKAKELVIKEGVSAAEAFERAAKPEVPTFDKSPLLKQELPEGKVHETKSLSGDTIIEVIDPQGGQTSWYKTDGGYIQLGGHGLEPYIPENIDKKFRKALAALSDLKGEEQFQKAMELGLIPKGSEYVAGDKGQEWGYRTPAQAKQLKDSLAEAAERNRILNELSAFRVSETEFDLVKAIDAGVPRDKLLKLFDKKAIDNAEKVVSKYKTQPQKAEIEPEKPKIYRTWADLSPEERARMGFDIDKARESLMNLPEGLGQIGASLHQDIEEKINLPGGDKKLPFGFGSTYEQAGKAVYHGAVDLPLMLLTLPAVGISTLARLAAGKPAAAGGLLKESAVGVKDFFVDLGKRFAVEPIPATIYTLVALGPTLISPAKGGGVKLVKGAWTKAHPSGLPTRALAIEADVSRIPWGEAGYEGALKAVGEALKKQVEASPETLGKVEKVVVEVGDKTLELKYRRTPMNEMAPDTVYHASPDVTALLKELKEKGSITVKGDLYTSPQAAMDFLAHSASGTPPKNPGILAIKTAQVGTKEWRLPFKEYRGAIEAEVVGAEGIKLQATEPNLYSKLFGKGTTHETFTQYMGGTQTTAGHTIRSGQIVPVYWLKAPGAKGVPPSMSMVYAATHAAIWETIKDIPHLRPRKIKLGFGYGGDVGLLRSARSAYDAIKVIGKELEARAAEHVKKIAKASWDEARKAKEYEKELTRLAREEGQKLLDQPGVKEALRRARSLEPAYEVNLTKYLWAASAGSRGELASKPSLQDEPAVRTTYYKATKGGELRKLREEREEKEAEELERRPSRLPKEERSRPTPEPSRIREEPTPELRERAKVDLDERRGELREDRELRLDIGERDRRVDLGDRRGELPEGEERDVRLGDEHNITIPEMFTGIRGKKEKKRRTSKGDALLEAKREAFRGALTWAQGALGKDKKPVYIAIKQPYESDDDIGYFIGEPPPGAIMQKGSRTPYETIQQISGKAPEKLKVKVGFMTATVTKPDQSPGKEGAIDFISDPKDKVPDDLDVKKAIDTFSKSDQYLRRGPTHTSEISLARSPHYVEEGLAKEKAKAKEKDEKGPKVEVKVAKVRVRHRADERGKPLGRAGTRTRVRAIKTGGREVNVSVEPSKVKLSLPKVRALTNPRVTAARVRGTKSAPSPSWLRDGSLLYGSKSFNRGLVRRIFASRAKKGSKK